MLDRIRSLADEVHPETVRIRRTLHRRPELAFQEHETAALIAETLREIGLEPIMGVAKTGVVAHVRGGQPGPVRALRADIDALPIHEANTFDFKSEIDGRMHACGHDAHTAMLLGVARVLHTLRDGLAGTVRLLFQPSEEKNPGGAKIMIEDGVLGEMDGVSAPEAIYGQHVVPHLASGVLGVRAGAFMASADEIYITIRGRGGHAAAPHLLIDPVLVQAHVITALQAVISRHRPPGIASLLSFGRVEADGATNVIPNEVRLVGTFRSMDEDWRAEAHRLIER
ncbi:MAG: amidohydrolase, partial [Bacteroidota bacterium]